MMNVSNTLQSIAQISNYTLASTPPLPFVSHAQLHPLERLEAFHRPIGHEVLLDAMGAVGPLRPARAVEQVREAKHKVEPSAHLLRSAGARGRGEALRIDEAWVCGRGGRQPFRGGSVYQRSVMRDVPTAHLPRRLLWRPR